MPGFEERIGSDRRAMLHAPADAVLAAGGRAGLLRQTRGDRRERSLIVHQRIVAEQGRRAVDRRKIAER